MLPTPVIGYSFNIVHWNSEDIRRIDTKIQKSLTLNGIYHPKAYMSGI